MDNGQRYIRWLSYMAIIAVFAGILLTTLGKAVFIVLDNAR
ncbi:hypothetical protein [Shewanella cyperi]|nr:hypothetical protein [Shewanella cyperi]